MQATRSILLYRPHGLTLRNSERPQAEMPSRVGRVKGGPVRPKRKPARVRTPSEHGARGVLWARNHAHGRVRGSGATSRLARSGGSFFAMNQWEVSGAR